MEASAEGAVDGALRRRCKYLAHMPESAHVVFVEVDWQGQGHGQAEKVVGEETLKAFEAPLRVRRTKRREKGRRDDRARVRAEEREREKMQLPPSWMLPQSDSMGPGAGVDYELLVSMAEEASALDSERPALHSDVQNTPVAAPTHTSTATVGGAWGTRTFASAAARSPQSHSLNPRGQHHHQQYRDQQRVPDDVPDEWDVDAAWHELEAGRAASGGGRRKRANKMIVLGGGGMGAGRRR